MPTRRTALDYLKLMRHGLGKIPDSRHKLLASFNDAGRALMTIAEQHPWYHTWSWRVVHDFTLDVPAGVSRVEIPADFGSLVVSTIANRALGSVRVVDAQEMANLRAAQATAPQVVYLCLEGSDDPNLPNDPGKRYAQIYPTQGGGRSDLRLSYFRVWKEIPEQLQDVAIPNIPIEYERLLVLMCREAAKDLENEAPSFESSVIRQEVGRLAVVDMRLSPEKGSPDHSVAERARWTGRDRMEIDRVIRP